MKTIKTILIITALLLTTVGRLSASSNYLYSPRGVPNSLTPTPFLTDGRYISSVRYQQVYSNTNFVGSPLSQGWITELSFNGNLPYFTATLSNVEIRLSTTARLPDALSTTFGDNIGIDEAVVYSGFMRITNDPTMDSYGTHIQLQNPFYYEIGEGNLLMEVRNYQPTFQDPEPLPQKYFSAVDILGDGSSMLVASDANALVGSADTEALRTRFTYNSVPEPGTFVLMVFGLICLVFGAYKIRKPS